MSFESLPTRSLGHLVDNFGTDEIKQQLAEGHIESWRDAQSCLRQSPELFTAPEERESAKDRDIREEAALRICGLCPVREICLRNALEEQQRLQHAFKRDIGPPTGVHGVSERDMKKIYKQFVGNAKPKVA
jgi:hypothetical protein